MMSTPTAGPPGPGTGRRRGRRPGGADTRAALLAAAREVFAEQGYSGATVRAIARRAGVDAAMVNHWFGGKETLFAEAVLRLPFEVEPLVAHLRSGPAGQLGARMARAFLTSWDAEGGTRFTALVRSVATHADAGSSLRDFFLENLFGRISDLVAEDGRELRATLVASQVMGLGMVRYVVHFEPLASAGVDGLVAAVGPNIQRYLTGRLD
ncbi:Transcriptional regulator, TetR family [Actinokineospora spheciospongiae]|uniref:Transcriptional regulator, TetR family n=2 Tax=Actinokineospora spheciospongiae TaxID=909613 RepID=W7J5F8_9PSEU|nr:Transcriptional regulator, TetR family [Actinokineospora spheciospongiae]